MRLLPVLLIGCKIQLDSQKDDTGSGGDEGCPTLDDGTWTLSGDAYDTPPSATLTFDSTQCSFSLNDWTATDIDLPTGASVSGYVVSFAGPGIWDGCTGYVEASDLIDGLCTDIGNWSFGVE